MTTKQKVIFAVSIILFASILYGTVTTTEVRAPQALPTMTVSAGDTIQAALNVAKAGETITVKAGTYNETLTLKTTGTAALPITLKCETPLGCTINSGSARSLVTYDGRQIGYYIVDGFRFISTIANTGSDPNLASVNFAFNFWGDGDKYEKGNDGFILRNCYVEGAVYFYGSDNLVENCELNGRGVVSNGLTERSQPSEDNIFRNNVIHDYTVRGGWTLSYVINTLWEGNTIYNIAPNGGGAAIDCDGAGHAVYECDIINNLFYNNGATQTIEMENGFDSLIEGNTIRDGRTGIHVINYNISNGSDPFVSDKDYKGMVTNTIIRNNVIYNMSGAGIGCHAVKGNQAYNNTIYNVANNGFFFQGYNYIYCPDWMVKNNIVASTSRDWLIYGSTAETIADNFYDAFSGYANNSTKTFAQWQAMGYDVNGKIGNPLFVNAAGGDFHLFGNSPACGMGAFPCSAVIPTETYTLTFTPTKTPTIAPSASFTPSSTVTAIPPTFTATKTVTPSPTFTATYTATNTPVPTSTALCAPALNVWVCDKQP